MANFLPGQKLTAADLNNAFQQVAGVQNPSNDYQWTKTSLGNLQSTWSTYTNTKNQTPTPLDIDIAVNPLLAPLNVPELGGQINAARCVFMNVGQMQITEISYNSPTGVVYPWGQFNNQFFIGVVGFQIFWQNAPIAGDNKAHFSLFSAYGNQPESDTPDAWTASEKLWQLDVCRNANKNNWWWTGIILERMPTALLANNLMTQLVAWPVLVEYTTTIDGTTFSRKTAALLAVSTYFDYLMRAQIWQASLVKSLANNIQTYIMPQVGGEGSTSEVNTLYIICDPHLVKTIASYNYAGKTTNAFFKQETNFVDFTHDFSESHFNQDFAERNKTSPQFHGLQCVRHNGKHVQLSGTYQPLKITGLSGEEIETDYPWQVQYLVAVADSDQLSSPVLSCVSCDWHQLEGQNDPVQSALGGIFNDLSCNIPGLSATPITDISKRLVLVDTRGVEGVKYFDTCPDFAGGSGKGVLHLSAWDGHQIDTMTLSNDMSVVLSSRADSNVQADLVDLSGAVRIDLGVYYI